MNATPAEKDVLLRQVRAERVVRIYGDAKSRKRAMEMAPNVDTGIIALFERACVDGVPRSVALEVISSWRGRLRAAHYEIGGMSWRDAIVQAHIDCCSVEDVEPEAARQSWLDGFQANLMEDAE